MLPFDRGLTRAEGEGGTSCHHPFPGRPGLSQSRSPRFFHARDTATVPSKNGGNVWRRHCVVTNLF